VARSELSQHLFDAQRDRRQLERVFEHVDVEVVADEVDGVGEGRSAGKGEIAPERW
jgi:hypothetical protein